MLLVFVLGVVPRRELFAHRPQQVSQEYSFISSYSKHSYVETISTELGQSAFSNPLLLDSGLFHNEVQYAFCIVGHTHSNCCDNLTPLEGKSICRLSLKILCQNSVLTPRSQANLFAQPNCRIQ